MTKLSRLLGILLLILISTFNLPAQDKACGTHLSEQTRAFLRDEFRQTNVIKQRAQEDLIRIAITAHIMKRSNGGGGLTMNQLDAALDVVNSIYAKKNIEFFIFDDVDYIESDEFFDFDRNQETAVAKDRDVPNTVNIYFANSITSDGNAICGYAYFPGNQDRIFMDNSCTLNGSTLSHELGHYLTLFHTHGTTNTGTTDELADGSNCETAGDVICDTPADPNLSGQVDANCLYTGTDVDDNGDSFHPDPQNLMSYAPKACRKLFTAGQYERAYAGYKTFRTYLIKDEFIADFEVEESIVCTGESVVVIDKTAGNYETIEWEFVGGSPEISNEINPTVSYSNPGTYDVKMTVSGNGYTDVHIIEDAIEVTPNGNELSSSLDVNFETSMLEDFYLFSPQDETTFSLESSGFESINSLSMQFFFYEEKGRKDYIIFDPLSHPGINDYVVSFDYAFTYNPVTGSQNASDVISLIAKSCNTRQTVWQVNSKSGATTDPQSVSFVPTASDWKHVELYVPVNEESYPVQLYLEAINNNNGNNFYIDNLEVNYTESILIRNVSTKPEQCAGDGSGEIKVEASYNSNLIEYSIDNETFTTSGLFSDLSSGNYTVTIKSVDKSLELPLTVTSNNPRPAKPIIVLNNNQLQLLASVHSIEWYYNNELINESNVTSINHEGPGLYYVIVKNESGCERVSDEFVVLGNEDLDAINIYPNPANNRIHISGVQLNNKDFIELSDISGKQMLTHQILSNEETIDISKLPEGIYHLIIKGESTPSEIERKILIKR